MAKKQRGNLKKLAANQFGIQYATESHGYYQDAKLHQNFDWQTHTPQLCAMCGKAYYYQTGDDSEDNRQEAVKQAESTWRYLWGGKKAKKVGEVCDYCQRFEELGYSCVRDDRECDCPKCMGFCECE